MLIPFRPPKNTQKYLKFIVKYSKLQGRLKSHCTGYGEYSKTTSFLWKWKTNKIFVRLLAKYLSTIITDIDEEIVSQQLQLETFASDERINKRDVE